MTTYYKVVRKEDNKYFSVTGCDDELDTNLEYRIGRWTTPIIIGSNIMVFKSLEKAKGFALSYFDYCIFECEVRNPSKTGIFFWSNYDVIHKLASIAKLKRWKKAYKKYITDIDHIPDGTIFCSAVKPITIVEEDTYESKII